ncbi:hypothetical protein BC629DRAFT_1445067 [Irpex lacteus]|nr:hypothetical protein BC629DRAFT_1445067 [Irpex lacteus]
MDEGYVAGSTCQIYVQKPVQNAFLSTSELMGGWGGKCSKQYICKENHDPKVTKPYPHYYPYTKLIKAWENPKMRNIFNTCRELQVQNGELRVSVKKLKIENAKLLAELETATTKPKDDVIPPAFQKHKDNIETASRKAAVQIDLFMKERYFLNLAAPVIDWKNPTVRYNSRASEERAAAAELFDFFKKQPSAIDLSTLIGREKWFGPAVKYKAIDQKSRLVGNTLSALPLVITALASRPSVVGTAESRRKDPLLRMLRGRSTDHAPPAYYPEGIDLSMPGTDRLIFYIPAIGYYFRAGLFGKTSITSTRIDSRSNGAKWGIDKEGITPASLAAMFTIYRFHVSGEPEFDQKESGPIQGSDPDADKYDWDGEYKRLRRLFHESWHLPGMQQIVGAISAVAFRGVHPSTVAHTTADQGAMLAITERNMRAVANFGDIIPSDLLQLPSRASSSPSPSPSATAAVASPTVPLSRGPSSAGPSRIATPPSVPAADLEPLQPPGPGPLPVEEEQPPPAPPAKKTTRTKAAAAKKKGKEKDDGDVGQVSTRRSARNT